MVGERKVLKKVVRGRWRENSLFSDHLRNPLSAPTRRLQGETGQFLHVDHQGKAPKEIKRKCGSFITTLTGDKSQHLRKASISPKKTREKGDPQRREPLQ